MRKIMISFLLLLGILTSAAWAKEVTVDGVGVNRESAMNDARQIAAEQVAGTLVDSFPVESKQKTDSLQRQAWQQFFIAKNSEAVDLQSEAYANAIKFISDATAEQGAPPSAFLLASRIYRHKGGISYAKNNFTRAAAVYLDEAMQQPESVQANLDAAIILYAGDVRYWDTYNDSKKNAFMYADKVLELCKNKKAEKNISASEEIFLEEAAALAFLIKENVAGSDEHFAQAEKIWIRNDEKTNSSLIKIVELNDQDVSGKDYYKPYALFKEYPQQGKWFWSVTNQAEACKEFLLNCLTGFYTEQKL